MTTTLEDADALCRLVRERDVVFALTHNYSGYPLVKQARAMVQSRHDWSRNLDTYANVLGSVRISAVSAGDAVGAAGLKTGT